MLGKILLSTVYMLGFASLWSCGTACPSRDTVTTAVKKIMPAAFDVVGIRGMAEIPGICEVAITVNKQPVVFYTDSKGKYVLSGSILEVGTGKNITMEGLQKYKR